MSDLYTTNDISKMDFKALKRKVQELEDTIAKMKRMYEDAIYNLDSSNFSSSWVREQDNMKAQIKLSAEELSSVYTRVDDNRTALETQIMQNAEAISLKASKTELDEWGNNLEEQIASIEVSADSIALAVNQVIKDTGSDAYKNIGSRIQLSKNQILATVSTNSSDYFESSVLPTTSNTSDKQKLMLCLYDGGYYSYDYGLKEWIFVDLGSSNTIKTQFKQTATGFKLSGDVSVDGNLIVDGTISASKIKTSELSCNRLYSGIFDSIYNSPYASIAPFPSSMNVGFGIYEALCSDALPNSDKCVFGINEVVGAGTGGMNLYSHGQNFLGHNSVQGKTYPKGIWDFSSCTKVILPDSIVSQTG